MKDAQDIGRQAGSRAVEEEARRRDLEKAKQTNVNAWKMKSRRVRLCLYMVNIWYEALHAFA